MIGSWLRRRARSEMYGAVRAECSGCSARRGSARARCSPRSESALGAAGLRVVAGRGVEHERDIPFGVMCDALGELAGTPGEVPVAERFRRHREVAASSRAHRAGRAAARRPALGRRGVGRARAAPAAPARPGPVLLVIAARPVGPAGRLLDAGAARRAGRSSSSSRSAATTPARWSRGCADPAVRERVVLEGRGNPLFLRELARVADRGDGALPATLVAASRSRWARSARPARADRGCGGRRGPVRPGARGRGRGARRRGRGSRRSTSSSPPTSCAPRRAPRTSRRRSADESVEPRGCPRKTTGAAALSAPPAGAGRGFVFRHPLVRRAVYDGASPGWRLGAHERAAAALAARGAGRSTRAFHVVRSAHVGDSTRSRCWPRRPRAAGESSPAAAAHWYAAALRIVPDPRQGRAPSCSRAGRRARRHRAARREPARRCWRPTCCSRGSSS